MVGGERREDLTGRVTEELRRVKVLGRQPEDDWDVVCEMRVSVTSARLAPRGKGRVGYVLVLGPALRGEGWIWTADDGAAGRVMAEGRGAGRTVEGLSCGGGALVVVVAAEGGPEGGWAGCAGLLGTGLTTLVVRGLPCPAASW